MNLHVTETPARLIELKNFIIITQWSYETLIGCVCVCVCLHPSIVEGSSVWNDALDILDCTDQWYEL